MKQLFGHNVGITRFKINVISGSVCTLINILINGLAYPIYLHYLGYEKYGIWIILFTILNIIQLTNLGIGPAIIKRVADVYNNNDIGEIKPYVSTAITTLFVCGMLSLTVLMLANKQIVVALNVNPNNATTLMRFLPYIGLLTIYAFIIQIYSGVITGLGRIDISNMCDALSKIIALTVSIILLANGWQIESLIIGMFLSFVFNHVALLVMIKKITSVKLFEMTACSIHYLKQLLSIGGGFFAGGIINILMSPFNKFIIARYIGIADIPVYEIGFNATLQLRNILESGFRAVAPEVIKIYAEYDKDKYQRIKMLHKRMITFAVVVGIPSVFLILMSSHFLLKLWLGARFVESLSPVFKILLIGEFLSLLGAPAYYILMGLGHSRQIFISFLIQSIGNIIVVLFILISGIRISTVLLAIAASIGMTVSTMYLIHRKKIALNYV